MRSYGWLGLTPFVILSPGPPKTDALFLHIITKCDYDCHITHVFQKRGYTKFLFNNICRFELLFEYTIYVDGYLYHVVNRPSEILQKVQDSIIKTI